MRGIEARKALEYARSQGWIPPEQQRTIPPIVIDGLGTAVAAKLLADALELSLTAERESHAVTKRALLRARGKASAKRVEALESALRDALWAASEIAAGGTSDETRRVCAIGESLLKGAFEP